jgi:hypothetical protein
MVLSCVTACPYRQHPSHKVDTELRRLKIRKAAEALSEGQLLASEESLEVRQALPLLASARVKADTTHAATHRRVGHRLSGVRALVSAQSAPSCLCFASHLFSLLCHLLRS